MTGIWGRKTNRSWKCYLCHIRAECQLLSLDWMLRRLRLFSVQKIRAQGRILERPGAARQASPLFAPAAAAPRGFISPLRIYGRQQLRCSLFWSVIIRGIWYSGGAWRRGTALNHAAAECMNLLPGAAFWQGRRRPVKSDRLPPWLPVYLLSVWETRLFDQFVTNGFCRLPIKLIFSSKYGLKLGSKIGTEYQLKAKRRLFWNSIHK